MARSCHRRAVSRRRRARKRSLLLGNDFSIAVSPLWTNGRSGFGARRLSAFYGLFRSVFLIFFCSTSFYASLCFIDLDCFCSKRIFLSSKLFFCRRFQFPSAFFHHDAETDIIFVSLFRKIVLRRPSMLVSPLGRRRKRWIRCDIERK